MNDKKFYKHFFILYGIIAAVVLAVFVILFYSVKLSRKSWNENLRTSVQNVLNSYEEGQWKVKEQVAINNSFASHAAAYKITNADSEEAVAVIIRIATFYGPFPAVFIYQQSEENVNDEAIFAGYSSLKGNILKQINAGTTDKRVSFWCKKIPYVLGKKGK